MAILSPDNKNIEFCASTLVNGDLVAFPTETVYGLGADARSDTAVKKIFDLKGRPPTNPLIVHYDSFDSIIKHFGSSLNEEQLRILSKLSVFWPGPLSVVLPKINGISNLVAAGGETVAVRVPDNSISLELLRRAGIPVAAPSANKSLLLSPTSAAHVAESFAEHDLPILDGGLCKVGIESTVLDITCSPAAILRPGFITAQQLSGLLNIEVQLGAASKAALPKSPGQMDVHYAPTKPLIFLDQLSDDTAAEKLAVILISEENEAAWQHKAAKVYCLSDNSNPEQIARNLYSVLREADKQPVELLAIEHCEEKGIGLAIMDRLRRASSK